MSSPSPHKPRRRAGKKGNGISGGSSLSPAVDNQLSKKEALVKVPVFPLASFLWPARGSVSQWEVLPLILMVVGLFRWAAGLWGYSGKCALIGPLDFRGNC